MYICMYVVVVKVAAVDLYFFIFLLIFFLSLWFQALHALSYFSMYVACIYTCLLTICCNMTAFSYTTMLLARRFAGWWVVVNSQR